jgi:CHAT domain-containing protein
MNFKHRHHKSLRSKLVFFILLALFICNTIEADGQASRLVNEAEQLIFLGRTDSAETLIEKGLKLYPNDYLSVSRFYDLAGEIAKFQGDMDVALVNWKQSIAIRRKHLPPNNPIQAWNYALLSNYYYEKIQPQKALVYADSCTNFLDKLKEEDLVAIKAHRIWNILAQSYKLQASNNGFDNYYEWHAVYLEVWELYKKSLQFQKEHGIAPIDYAKTKHLLANSYNDMTIRAFSFGKAHPEGAGFARIADSLYNEVIMEWEALYGATSIQKARTLYVKGILQYILPDSLYPLHIKDAIQTYQAAIKAYDFDLNKTEAEHGHISNKSDLLMCLKSLIDALLIDYMHTNEIGQLQEASKTTAQAIRLWNYIHQSFQSENINQLLSLYHLVPFKYSFFIEYEKKQRNLAASDEKMFAAVQYMRYYDLLKLRKAQGKENLITSLKEMQLKLEPDEVFIDFVYSTLYGIHVAAVTKNSYDVFVAEGDIIEWGISFYKALENQDHQAYAQSASQLYTLLLQPILTTDVKRIIICPTDFLQEIPFEALLTKKPEASPGNNYRDLPYLIKGYSVSYALSAAIYSRNTEHFPFDLGLFTPTLSAKATQTDLPFARTLNDNLTKKFSGTQQFPTGTETKQLLLHPGILHISAHGLIEQNKSENAALILSGEPFSLEDAYQLPVQASLVVLNTCNSSLGAKLTDDGIEGFARAFHQNGAKAVLSNLWEVDDRASHNVLELFYEFLHTGQSTEESLRLAKLKYIAESPNEALAAPYYWSGHVITGNNLVFDAPNTSNLDYNSAYWYALLFIAVLVLILMVLFFQKRKKKRSSIN